MSLLKFLEKGRPTESPSNPAELMLPLLLRSGAQGKQRGILSWKWKIDVDEGGEKGLAVDAGVQAEVDA